MDKDRKDNLEPQQGSDGGQENTSRSFEGKYRSEPAGVPENNAFEDETVFDQVNESEIPEEDEPDVMIPTPLEKKPVRKKKRGKKSLPLIITALIFVVLFAGYFVMVRLIPQKIVKEEDDFSTNFRHLVPYVIDQISAVSFDYRDGYHYKMLLDRYVNEGGYNTIKYSVENKEEFEYDQSLCSTMMTQIVDIASGKIANQNTDLSTYGLDDPNVTVTYYIFDENGNTVEGVTLLVGNAAPVGNGYYAMLDGEDAIYVIGYSDADYLVKKDYSYRVLTLLIIDDYKYGIDMIDFKRGDYELNVALASAEEKMTLEYATTYRIYVPAVLNCNTFYLEDKVLSKMTMFVANSVVEDYPENLADYGLAPENEPLEVTIREADGTVTKFTLSNERNEDGTIYGKVSGMTTVFTFNAALFDFANITYDQLLDMTIWLCHINTVDHVEFYLEGESHTLKFEHENGNISRFILDDADIEENDARMLYTRMLQIYLDDILSEDESGGSISYSFKIHTLDGKVRSLELAEINQRRFQVILDGVPQDYYVRYNALKQLKDAFAALAEGLHLSYAL